MGGPTGEIKKKKNTHVVAGRQGNDGLGVDVGRAQPAVEQDGQGLVGGGEEVAARDDGGGVDEGVLEVGVAGEQLRLQERGVGHVLEEGHVGAVRRGDVLERNGFEQRHCRVSGGALCWLAVEYCVAVVVVVVLLVMVRAVNSAAMRGKTPPPACAVRHRIGCRERQAPAPCRTSSPV